MRYLIVILLLLAPSALRAEETTVIEDAPVPAAEVQDHTLPNNRSDEERLPPSDTEANYETFDPTPYAAQIKKVEDYLSSFKTLEARFSQTSMETAVIVQGNLQISRPGKMRLEYVHPERLEIVVNGKKMRYHDIALDQVTFGDIPDSPFEVLLYEKVSFAGNSKVVDVQEDDASLAITVQPATPDGKLRQTFIALTLVFSKQPFELKRIVRADPNNHKTSIFLMDTTLDAPLDPELFNLKNPTKKKKKN